MSFLSIFRGPSAESPFAQRAVLRVLAAHTLTPGSDQHLSAETIARRSGRSLRSVRRSLACLMIYEWVTVDQAGGYSLNAPVVAAETQATSRWIGLAA